VTLTFVETSHFSRQLTECGVDEDFRALQLELLRDPERGDLLVGCHGLRKTRMSIHGRGKSSGARVIYLYLPEEHILYFFLLYKKSAAVNLSQSQRNSLGVLAEQIKSSYAKKRQNS
jgi:hypothetical protein